MKIRKTATTLIIGILCVIMILSTASAAPSVTSTAAERDLIAKDWKFLKQGLYENNCLAWALGNETSYEWPWSGYPTLAQVDQYMKDLGYTAYTASSSSMSRAIYAYGTTDAVTHFARGLGNGPLATVMSAKWGRLEAFTHTTTNPYQPNSYGPLVRGYN